MATTQDIINAGLVLQTNMGAFFQAYKGLSVADGRTLAQQLEALAAQAAADRKATEALAASIGAGGTGTGGTGGTGGTTSPTLARIIAGFQKGYASNTVFPNQTYPVYAKTTQEGQWAPMPGTGLTYMNHAISTVGNADHYAVTKDFLTVTKQWNFGEWSKAYPEEQVQQSNDGSQMVYWRSQKSPGGAGEWDSLSFAFKMTGSRYFALSGRVYNHIWFECDGKFAQPAAVTFDHNGQWWTWDLGNANEHTIVVHCAPDMVFAAFAAQPGATIVPYDFMATSFSVGFLGDSYAQGSTYSITGMGALDFECALLGAKAYRGSVVGGTGYARTIQGQLIASSDIRLNHLKAANVDMPWVRLGINDGWPTDGETGADVRAAMKKTYAALRAPNPDNVLVVNTPWCPRESDGNTSGSRPQLMGRAMLDELTALGGKWVLIDTQLGKWINSKGISSNPEGPWITGNGRVGATTGSGNADQYVSADGTHPTESGHVYLGVKNATYVKAAVTALV